MDNKYWGKHLILNLSGCPTNLITDEDNIREWSKTLIKAIDMIAYGDPFLKYFDNHDPGYTFSQIILTSNITAHFVDTHGGAYIDIFSCKDFVSEDALKVCVEFFSPEHTESQELYRGPKK